ncbi:MAG: helix-hairpin-helix domain-containing protein [Prevotellaceae bacterium]|jgi:hypothetical protein|nr:helix-hairpin-helix domain-containing protein [Prevotellaceae bacterium]
MNRTKIKSSAFLKKSIQSGFQWIFSCFGGVKRHFCFIFLFLPFCLYPQDGNENIDQIIADIFEQYAEESEDAVDFDSFYDDLIQFAHQPINLNETSREELEKLPFLSDMQVENILYYIYKAGKMESIYELQLIDGLDMTDIRRMLPFVYVGEKALQARKIYWRDMFKYGKNDLLFRLDRNLEAKAGYQLIPPGDEKAEETNAKKYSGSPYYNSLRYRFRFSNRIQAGFTAEKDAGEQFWGAAHKGYDFYSAYLQLDNFGKFKTIVAGDFKANFGQGLALRQDFSMGKSSYVLNVSPRTQGLRKYSSTNEYQFFRGAGATVQAGNFTVTAFYSNKQIDGDTVDGTFASIYKTGLHRTQSEVNKKNTVNEQVAGGNITFNYGNIQIGATAVHTFFDHELLPDKSVYNRFYFEGKEQTTAGIHYRARWRKFHFFGETAMTNNFALATLNGLAFNPVSTVNLVLLQRYFSPEYDVFYAVAFSEQSRITNEKGFYIGTEIRPVKKWKVSAYADSYAFPWARFGVDSPSFGSDYLFQADYAAQRNLSMFWRVKYEKNETNLSESGTTAKLVVPQKKAAFRYNLSHSQGRFSFKTQLDGNLYRKAAQDWTYGVSALQDVSYKFSAIPLKLDFRFQFFDAKVYDNRFYTYEKDILYAFSIPMYYGAGNRYYLNMNYEFNRNLSVWFKLAQTVYADDRKSIGSGNEEIQGNRKTDFRFLLRYRF